MELNLNAEVVRILEKIKKLTKEQQMQLFEALKIQDLEEKASAGDINAFTDTLREYLMQYCIEDKNGELHINLPPKGEFEGFYFSGNKWKLMMIYSDDNPHEYKEIRNKTEELIRILGDYIKAYGIEMDGPEIQKHILIPILKNYHIRYN